MLKDYLIKSYGYLVKVGRWSLEPVDEGYGYAVPQEYREAVAQYLFVCQ